MSFELHNMNTCMNTLLRSTKFYTTLFDVLPSCNEEVAAMSDVRTDRAYTGKVNLSSDGNIEIHRYKYDLDAGCRTEHVSDPIDHGQLCCCTHGMESVARRCDEAGIRSSDHGCWASFSCHQIFPYYPDGHSIEVDQPSVFAFYPAFTGMLT